MEDDCRITGRRAGSRAGGTGHAGDGVERGQPGRDRLDAPGLAAVKRGHDHRPLVESTRSDCHAGEGGRAGHRAQALHLRGHLTDGPGGTAVLAVEGLPGSGGVVRYRHAVIGRAARDGTDSRRGARHCHSGPGVTPIRREGGRFGADGHTVRRRRTRNTLAAGHGDRGPCRSPIGGDEGSLACDHVQAHDGDAVRYRRAGDVAEKVLASRRRLSGPCGPAIAGLQDETAGECSADGIAGCGRWTGNSLDPPGPAGQRQRCPGCPTVSGRIGDSDVVPHLAHGDALGGRRARDTDQPDCGSHRLDRPCGGCRTRRCPAEQQAGEDETGGGEDRSPGPQLGGPIRRCHSLSPPRSPSSRAPAGYGAGKLTRCIEPDQHHIWTSRSRRISSNDPQSERPISAPLTGRARARRTRTCRPATTTPRRR